MGRSKASTSSPSVRYKKDKDSQTSDVDPTLNFFYKPHTITVLIVMLSIFLYVALSVTESDDPIRNTKAGIIAAASVLIAIGLLMFSDGPFIRPHPALWRIVTAVSTVYLLLLVFMLFQNKNHARHLLKYVDPSLGVKLPERSYAASCQLSWENIYGQLDEFVIAHILGWVGKALMLRDYWIAWILSIMFELLEYSLQHQLPNFAECWWDHWILDVLVCNYLGLRIGMAICRYLDIKTYTWHAFKEIPTYTGKVKRALGQFTPYSWTQFNWEYTRDFSHFLMVTTIIIVFLQGELNAFYLKYLLWIPSKNPFNSIRLFLLFLLGSAGIREAYQYLTDSNSKKLGQNAWLIIAITMTESLICVKFSRNEFHEPFPKSVIFFWATFSSIFAIFTFYVFVISPYRNRQKLKRS